jgi:hypothetical protein
VSVKPPNQVLSTLTYIYETWYIYYGTQANLNGVLHKSLPSVCVLACVAPIAATQQHGKDFTMKKNTHLTID